MGLASGDVYPTYVMEQLQYWSIVEVVLAVIRNNLISIAF